MKKFFNLFFVLVIVFSLTLASCTGNGVTQKDGPGPGEPAAEELGIKGKHIKAGFIYVGPVNDFGWTHAHDQGRKYVDEAFDWLETTYVEQVSEADCPREIDRLVNEEKCDVIFTTSFGFMESTFEAAEKYPNVIFEHCSGYKTRDNMGAYFTDVYQIFYLNGLIAGALSKTGKAGYIGAQPIPEIKRHIDAFTIGFTEINPEATTTVKWLMNWYDPAKSREASESLVAEGCDVLIFSEDSPTVVEVAEEHTNKGNQTYTFSHYSSMKHYGPGSCASGHLFDWGKMYQEILTNVYTDEWVSENMIWLVDRGTAILGAEYGQPINETFVEELKNKMMPNSEESVYDFVMKRYEQFKEPNIAFDPFTGPLYDSEGVLRIEAGVREPYSNLSVIDWFVKGVKAPKMD